MKCRHETLAVGAICPDCGRGKLYALDEAVTIRIDGNALLTAARYELERLRCSACMAVFTAALPDGVSAHKYSHRACVWSWCSIATFSACRFIDCSACKP